MMVWALHQLEGISCEELLPNIYTLLNSATKDIEVKDWIVCCVNCLSSLAGLHESGSVTACDVALSSNLFSYSDGCCTAAC